MSNGALKLLAGAGATSDPVYVDDVFQTTLYTGTLNTYPNNVVNGMDFDGKGGLLWIKNRDQADSHYLYDTARGDHKPIYSNEYYGQGDQTAQVGLAFNSNGFSVGDIHQTNAGGEDFVAWNFLKQEKFFDIVQFTGDGTTNRQISHNLGSVPGMILLKDLGDNNQSWYVYHVGAGATHYGQLNANGPFYDDAGPWNDTTPTDTVFTLGLPGYTNTNGYNYIVYLFANNEADFGTDSDEAIIKCGSYTGNGNATTGVTLDLGFEPQFMFIKNISTSSSWFILDNMRGMSVKANDDPSLAPDLSAAEGGGNGSNTWSEPFATGIKMTAAGTATNANGDTHIYMAIRRPHKPASEFAATKLFNVDAGANTTPGFDTGFPVDTGIFRAYSYSGDFDIMSRLTTRKRLDFPSAGTEANKGTGAQMDHMDGWSTSAGALIGWAWRRAPGYHDVVCYTGTGSSGATVGHNLEVIPEFIWFKRRNGVNAWECYHSALGATKHINLNNDLAARTSSARFNDTAPTASVFTLGNDSNVNVSTGTYIAYLFASLDGIQKVGSYSGTGSDVNVDCGFSAGARFILIKRTDDAGDWYLYDSVQGIVAGNDPYLLLSQTAAQVTNTDYIDPLNAGFTVTSSAPAALNNSGSTYIFLAIA